MVKRRRSTVNPANRRVSVAPDEAPIELKFEHPRDGQGWPTVEAGTVVQGRGNGQYKILKRKPLGQGDFARIYYAERELGKLHCALRVLKYKPPAPPKPAPSATPGKAGHKGSSKSPRAGDAAPSGGGVLDYEGRPVSEQEVRAEFERTVAGLLATRAVPHVLQYVEHFLDGGSVGPYTVTKPVCQGTLETYMEQVYRGEVAPMPYLRVTTYLRQAAQALADLHERSLVHADLSLRHLLMEREDSIRLSDLGWPATSTDDKTLTHKSGTAAVAPELWDGPAAPGQAVDHYKSDAYALGVLLLTVLTLDLDLARPGQEAQLSKGLRDKPHQDVLQAVSGIYGNDPDFKLNSDETKVIAALLRSSPVMRMGVREAAAELNSIPQRRSSGQTTKHVVAMLRWLLLGVAVVVGLLEKSSWSVPAWLLVSALLAESLLFRLKGRTVESRVLQLNRILPLVTGKDNIHVKDYSWTFTAEQAVLARRSLILVSAIALVSVSGAGAGPYDLGPGQVAVLALTSVFFLLTMAVEAAHLAMPRYPRAAVLLSSLLPGHVQSAWPSLQLALALAVLTRHPYWEAESQVVGDRFHAVTYTVALMVTYFILGFWLCYLLFCLLRGLVLLSHWAMGHRPAAPPGLPRYHLPPIAAIKKRQPFQPKQMPLPSAPPPSAPPADPQPPPSSTMGDEEQGWAGANWAPPQQAKQAETEPPPQQQQPQQQQQQQQQQQPPPPDGEGEAAEAAHDDEGAEEEGFGSMPTPEQLRFLSMPNLSSGQSAIEEVE